MKPLDVVEDDEVVVVGRIEIAPQLRPAEQQHLAGRYKKFRNKVILVRGRQDEPLPAFADARTDSLITITLGEDFLLSFSRQPLHLLGGYVFVDKVTGGVGEIALQGHWQVEIRPDDEAVYIGTIIYIRNDEDIVLDYIVKDDYAEAYEKYRQHYDREHVLRKALIQNPRIN